MFHTPNDHYYYILTNNRIYKSKYDPKPEEDERTGRASRADGDSKKDKKRDKSRTRSIFGRRKADKA